MGYCSAARSGSMRKTRKTVEANRELVEASGSRGSHQEAGGRQGRGRERCGRSGRGLEGRGKVRKRLEGMGSNGMLHWFNINLFSAIFFCFISSYSNNVRVLDDCVMNDWLLSSTIFSLSSASSSSTSLRARLAQSSAAVQIVSLFYIINLIYLLKTSWRKSSYLWDIISSNSALPT